MQMNLNTTMKAYPKLSDSVLKDYVTKENLSNYVTDVEVDGIMYGRKDKEWVPIDMAFEDIYLYYGVSSKDTLSEVADIKALDSKTKLDSKTTSYELDYDQEVPGFLYICMTRKCKNIKWMGIKWDYAELDPIKEENTPYTYFCYRSTSQLVPNEQMFVINF